MAKGLSLEMAKGLSPARCASSPCALLSTAQMKLRLIIFLALVLVLAVPTTAAARVRLVRVTSPIGAGSYAHLTASVSPSRTCSISVSYKSGRSHAAGLYPKRPTGGRVSWTWKGRSERRSS